MPKRTRKHEKWLYGKLTDPRVVETYVNAALQDSQEMFLVAMRNVAEAHRMARVAQQAGVNRESLYRAFSKQGNPTLNTLTSVLDAIGLTFSVKLKTVGRQRTARFSGQCTWRSSTPETAIMAAVRSTAGMVCITDCPQTSFTPTSQASTSSAGNAVLSAKQEVPVYLLAAETPGCIHKT